MLEKTDPLSAMLLQVLGRYFRSLEFMRMSMSSSRICARGGTSRHARRHPIGNARAGRNMDARMRADIMQPTTTKFGGGLASTASADSTVFDGFGEGLLCFPCGFCPAACTGCCHSSTDTSSRNARPKARPIAVPEHPSAWQCTSERATGDDDVARKNGALVLPPCDIYLWNAPRF